MSELKEETVVRATRSQASCDLEGEAVILSLGSGTYHGLNDVGSFVWKRVQEPCSVATLRDAVLEEYEVDASTALEDLFSVLEALRGADLIEVCS